AWHGSRRFAFKGQDHSLQVVPSHQQGLAANLRKVAVPSHPQAKVIAEPPFVASSALKANRGGTGGAGPSPSMTPAPAPAPAPAPVQRPKQSAPSAAPRGSSSSGNAGDRAKAAEAHKDKQQERGPSEEGEKISQQSKAPESLPEAAEDAEEQGPAHGQEDENCGDESQGEEMEDGEADEASNETQDEGQEEEGAEDDAPEDDGQQEDEGHEDESHHGPGNQENHRTFQTDAKHAKAQATAKPVRAQRRSPKRRKERAAKGMLEDCDFDQVLAEERSRWAREACNSKGSPENCCLCNKPVPNLKYATELGVCKGHYRMLQAEERALASFSTSRQQSDPRAPSNHLFHLSAYLDVAEESALITDLYLGGGINQLTALIRLLVLKGHSLQDRWHGLTAPFMSFVLMEYAPFLALAFADVLDAENQRPDIAALRVRAKAAMVNWSPSRRLTSLTGETLEQTLADAVSASQDISLPPEHMPVDSTLPPKRKKKKKAGAAKDSAAPGPSHPPPPVDVQVLPSCSDDVPPESQEAEFDNDNIDRLFPEQDLNDDFDDDDDEIIEDPAPLGPHRVWSFLTGDEVQTWAMAGRRQAQVFSKESLRAGDDVPPSWSFLQDPADLQHLDFLTKHDLASLWEHTESQGRRLG
ncbi:elmoC, partial [Symbiodinium pilosum]